MRSRSSTRELRVHGVEGLRVADASIMPAVTTGNTNAPSIMIGERVADFVAGGSDRGDGSAYSGAGSRRSSAPSGLNSPA